MSDATFGSVVSDPSVCGGCGFRPWSFSHVAAQPYHGLLTCAAWLKPRSELAPLVKTKRWCMTSTARDHATRGWSPSGMLDPSMVAQPVLVHGRITGGARLLGAEAQPLAGAAPSKLRAATASTTAELTARCGQPAAHGLSAGNWTRERLTGATTGTAAATARRGKAQTGAVRLGAADPRTQS